MIHPCTCTCSINMSDKHVGEDITIVDNAKLCTKIR